ncbi:unnamed protein product, partial [Candidula unifasciata]
RWIQYIIILNFLVLLLHFLNCCLWVEIVSLFCLLTKLLYTIILYYYSFIMYSKHF